MAAGKQDIGDQARSWLDELRMVFKQRRGQYGRSLIAGGYSNQEGKRTLVHAVMYPWNGRGLPKVQTVEYPAFVLFRRQPTVDEFWTCFESLVLTQTFQLPREDPMSFGGRLEQPTYQQGGTYPFYSTWPCVWGRVTAQPDGRVVHRKLSKAGSDLFPGPQDALEEWTGVTSGYSGFAPAVYCLLPDFRARIAGVEIATDSVRVRALNGPAGSGQLRVQYYAKSEGQVPKHGGESVQKNHAVCRIGYQPERFIVDLYSPPQPNPIDWRDIDVRSSLPPSDVRYVASADTIRNMVRGGESTYVEFKLKLPSNELAESVCAFANTKGGAIIVGIGENSKVIGFQQPKYGPDHVDNVISATLDPVPGYKIRSVRLDGKPLLVIEVPEGTAKPYTLRQRGVYVRSNATDRGADRNEIIELSRPKTAGQ
jgi:hypothetical protein